MNEEYYIVRIKKRWVRKFCILLIVSVSFVFVYLTLYSYRYERFKDGHTYMRYDKWLDKYEKYDIPTKEWKELTR